MIIAATLVAVMGVAIAETLRAARDADRRLQLHAERRAEDQAIVNRMANDLRALMPLPATTASTNFVTGLLGESNPRADGRDLLSLPAEEAKADQAALDSGGVSPPYAERDRITISILPGARRFGSLWPAGAGAIQSIIWEVDDDPTTPEFGLVRRPTTIQNPLSGALPEPVEMVGPNVCGITMRYFDGTTWQTTWDSSALSVIPQAIEIALAVREKDGTIHRVLSTVAPFAGRPTAVIVPTPTPTP
jgi:type II secretory pathway component PulJ